MGERLAAPRRGHWAGLGTAGTALGAAVLFAVWLSARTPAGIAVIVADTAVVNLGKQ